MSTASPRRRLTLALTVGALVGLTTLAMPTVASAAEICVTGTTPTAATQPWQTFAESPNQFVIVEDAYAAMVPTIAAQLATVDADFTQAEYDAMYAAVGAAFTGAGETSNAATTEFGAQEQKLIDDLLAVDPDSAAESQAFVDTIGDALENSPYASDFSGVYNNYLAELGAYVEAVQAAITAATPRPTVPASFTAASDAFAAGVVGLGAFIQLNVYDAAATHVVFAQECSTAPAPAVLAATGSNPAPLAAGGGLLLLLGAVGVIAMRRRSATSA